MMSQDPALSPERISARKSLVAAGQLGYALRL
jgi:hypothetical protein